MSTCASRWVRTALFLCALVVPTAASAQFTIAGIKTGTLTVTRGDTRPVLNIASGILDIGAAFDDGAFEAAQCQPCRAGAALGVGGRIVATGKGAQVYEADFTITGTSLEVDRSGYADLELSGTFAFQGRVVVSPRRDSRADEKDPAIELQGGGTVTVKLSSSQDPETGERLYFFQEATYQFSPIPQ